MLIDKEQNSSPYERLNCLNNFIYRFICLYTVLNIVDNRIEFSLHGIFMGKDDNKILNYELKIVVFRTKRK